MPTQIKEAMVLWYDIARQGCTNENMAKNPVLRDLSGNGHDATCYNFAWSRMSGIGGYQYSFTPAIAFNGNVEYNVYNTKVVITNTGTGTFGFWQTPIPSQEVSHSYKIRVTGITGSGLSLSSNLSGMIFDQISEDGEYIIPEWFNSTEGVQFPGLRFTEDYNNQSCNITVELLPEYPNALVSDGVDDYAQVDNLPVLNDWTIFIKKDIVKLPDIGWLLVDGGDAGDSTLQYKYGGNEFGINSFGYTTNVTDYVEKLDVFTPTSFNGNYIQKGNWKARRTLLYLFGGESFPLISMALYNLIVFNRTLTTEEIEWVKRNLM